MRHPARPDLIAGLNDDLARAYAKLIQSRTFASSVRGTDRLVLRPLFARRIAHGITHAGILSDAIVALGGRLTTDTAPIRVADDPEGMLRIMHEAERTSVDAYLARRSLARTLGERDTALALGTLGADAICQRDQLERWLTAWVSGESPPEAFERSIRNTTAGITPAGVALSDEDQNAGSES